MTEKVEFACSCTGFLGRDGKLIPSDHCEACHPRFAEWRAKVQAEYERTGQVPKWPAYLKD